MKEKKRKKIQKTLYGQFLEHSAEFKEEERIKNELQSEAIVIRKISASSKIIELFSEWIYRIIYFLFILLITAFVSIGVTVVVNGSLRNTLIEILKKSF